MYDLREKLGISQEQYAVYLGVPRSQVAAAEAGTRHLQGNVLPKVIVLKNLLDNKPPEPPTQLVQINQEEAITLNEALQAQIKECEFQLIIANKKMANMKTEYEAYSNSFLVVNYLHSLPDEGKTDREKNLEGWIELRSTVKLSSCGLQVQSLLQLEIDTLEFKAAQALKKMVVL